MNIRMRVPVRAQILMRYQTLARNLTEFSFSENRHRNGRGDDRTRIQKPKKAATYSGKVGENISYTLRWCQSLINGMTEPRLLS